MRTKWIMLIMALLWPSPCLFAATYYVDGVNGNDSNSGTTLTSSWKTMHKANQTLTPGDTVYIRGGNYHVGNPIGNAGADPTKQGINPKNSGTPGNPITYANYNDEDVQFVGTDKYCWAVKLFNGIQDNPIPTDYIIVKGLHFKDFFRFLWILKSSHCEVAFCKFQKSREFVDWRGSTLYKNAQYNHIHHCTFSEYGDFKNLNDNGVLLEIGNEYAPANDLTSFNLIEDCHLYHSGHHVVGLMGSNNVLRNNYIHNENWWEDSDNNCKWGNRIVYMQSDDSGEGVMCNRRNLIEGNRIAFGGETAETIDPNDFQVGGGGISKFSMPYNIVRKNMLYYTLTSGMFFQTYHHGNVVYNHVYHNVFFRNGYSDNPKIGNSGGHAIFFNFNQGYTPENPPCIYEQYGNCIKNNIFHDNRNRSNKTEPILGHCYAGAITYPPFPTNTIENNWKEAGDPLFVNDGGPIPSGFVHDGTPEIDPFGPQPDFRLGPDSPCIDAGGFLTTITSAGGSGTSFQVADAGYFMDGWGIEHVQGDEIQLQGSSQRARIIAVNYTTNTITVDKALTWTLNQGVSLAYEGSAPDLGAYEYVPGIALNSPAGGETWVRGFSHAITWSSSGVTKPVRIELFKAGVLNQVIAENQAVANGSYAWPILANQATGNDYTVKLTAGTYSDTSGAFTIAAPSKPVVQTLEAQSITASSASLRGTIHPMGLATTYYFEYGLTTDYGSETAGVTLAAGDETTTVQAAISNLNASTIYHFRLIATNSAGTTEGNDLTFTTSSSGGGGGGDGSGDSGGGGGGGCFIASAWGLNPWFMVFGLFAGWLVWTQIAKRRKNRIKFLVVLTGICFLSGAVSAQIIPDDRRINWSPGIPGGIPNYPVGVNVKDYGAVGDNAADDTVAIQNAINACPAGQAVYLPEGIYRTTTRLNVNKGIVIRGEGPSKTKILSDSGDAIIIYVGASGGGPTGTAVAIHSGYAKDSSTIVVADASAFSVGDYAGIYQDNEPGLVYPQGYSTICTWCGFGGNYLTCMAQTARVTNKNGNELTLSQPLYYGFQAALNPKIRKISMIQGFGLEDLGIEKIRNAGASSTGSITAAGLAYSWIKNVHSRMCLGAHVRMSYSYGCVIRDSFFDDAFLRTGSRSYGIFLIFSNSSNLIENNVLYRVTPAMCMEGGGSGNVFAYNFTKDSFHDSDPTWFFGASAITHGAHPYMNLFEGNALEGMHFDNTWGSSSHNTCFRNHIRRACGQAIYGVKAVDVHEHNYYHNFVGNVLGLVGQTGTWGPAQCNVNNVMWRLGCLSSGAGGNPSDPDVAVRTLRHGNFSMIADDTEWDPNISDHTFPDSYYLTSKPAWFGSIPWPPIGPDVNGFVHKIPAQVRFESLPAINSFTANPAVIAQGQSSVLSWTVTNADSLSIDQGIGTVSGTSTTVSPTATTTYTLTATNGIGSSTAIVIVTVQSGGGGGGDSGGGGGGGGGCFIATVAHGSVQWSGLLPLFLFLLSIGLVVWNFGKRKTFQSIGYKRIMKPFIPIRHFEERSELEIVRFLKI